MLEYLIFDNNYLFFATNLSKNALSPKLKRKNVPF